MGIFVHITVSSCEPYSCDHVGYRSNGSVKIGVVADGQGKTLEASKVAYAVTQHALELGSKPENQVAFTDGRAHCDSKLLNITKGCRDLEGGIRAETCLVYTQIAESSASHARLLTGFSMGNSCVLTWNTQTQTLAMIVGYDTFQRARNTENTFITQLYPQDLVITASGGLLNAIYVDNEELHNQHKKDLRNGSISDTCSGEEFVEAAARELQNTLTKLRVNKLQEILKSLNTSSSPMTPEKLRNLLYAAAKKSINDSGFGKYMDGQSLRDKKYNEAKGAVIPLVDAWAKTADGKAVIAKAEATAEEIFGLFLDTIPDVNAAGVDPKIKNFDTVIQELREELSTGEKFQEMARDDFTVLVMQ